MRIFRVVRRIVDRLGRHFGSAAALLVWAVGAGLILVGAGIDNRWWTAVCVTIGLVGTALAMVVAVELRVAFEMESESRRWRRRSETRYLAGREASGAGFFPLSIPPTRGLRRLSTRVGRGGADVADDKSSDANLQFLLEDAGIGRPMLDLIGTTPEVDALQDVADVRLVVPGLTRIRLRRGVAYVVVSTSAFCEGAWQGALSTDSRSVGEQILSALRVARSYGVVSVLLDRGHPPTHLSGQLERSVDIVFSGDGVSTRGPSVRTRVLDVLERFMSSAPR